MSDTPILDAIERLIGPRPALLRVKDTVKSAKMRLRSFMGR